MHLKIRSILHLNTPFRRYVFIGGSVYVLELIIIVVAQRLGANSVVAVGLSFWLGMMISFVLQKVITFRDKRIHHRILIPQIILYSLLVLFNFTFTVFAAYVLANVLPAVIIRTGALGLTTIWNFYLYRTKIFKTDDPTLY